MEVQNSRTAALVTGAMQAKNVTREALADLTGIPRTTLFRRLRGITPFTVAEIALIADALNVPPSTLIDFSGVAA